MFEGDGFGVGLAVQQLDVEAWPPGGWPVPAGVVARPSRLSEVLPVSGRSAGQLAAELGRITAAEAQLAAYKAEVVCGLAALRPDSGDRLQGEPGAASPGWVAGPEHPPAGVSEFFLDELAMALGTSKTSAAYVWVHAEALWHRLPGTWAALADGELDWPRARAIAAEVAGVEAEPAVLAAVEAAVLPVAAEFTVTGLKALVQAELLARDAEASDERRRRAARGADARVTPTGNGRAQFGADMSLADAQACFEVADHYARMAKADGDTRPIGVIRAEMVSVLMLHPGDPDRPPVTAHLTVTAPMDALQVAAEGGAVAGDEAADGDASPPTFAIFRATGTPGRGREPAPRRAPVASLGGQPITAAHLRALLEFLDALCPGGLQAPPGGSLHLALTDPDGALRAVLTRRELERLVRRGCPDHASAADCPPGNGSDCGCPLVDRPREVDRYRPSTAQYRFLRTRDRRCRMPGCRRPAGWADVDHVVAHGHGGPTDCANLCCLCRSHHRLKTLAPGWTFTMNADGVLTVTTPSGVTRTTRPPGLSPRDSGRPYRPGPEPPIPKPNNDPPPF